MSPEQTACIARAAEASPEFATFFGISQLLGTAIIYGPGNETDAVLEAGGIRDLLPLSVEEATRNFEGWARQTLRACGLPELRLDGQAGNDPGGLWKRLG